MAETHKVTEYLQAPMQSILTEEKIPVYPEYVLAGYGTMAVPAHDAATSL